MCIKYTYVFKSNNEKKGWKFGNVNQLCDFINRNFNVKLTKHKISNYYQNRIKNPNQIFDYIHRVRV